DNGTGIAPEVREKLFNPFFTTKPAGEGTGLGLSISHDIIVKQHGGSIEVDTQPGHVTEFRIVLPLAGLIKWGGRTGTRSFSWLMMSLMSSCCSASSFDAIYELAVSLWSSPNPLQPHSSASPMRRVCRLS